MHQLSDNLSWQSLLFIVLFIVSFSSASLAESSIILPDKQINIHQSLQQLENKYHGHLGLFAINTKDNAQINYHAKQRFPLCSTAKIMVVAAILKKNSSKHWLQQRVFYTKHDIVSAGYAPITKHHLPDGMTTLQLCAAAIHYSDNAASNLLIKKLGGPKVVTAFARSIGDDKFRLDRTEPTLNFAIPGDLRDTSTPAAMAHSLQHLVLGQTLNPKSRRLLQSWLTQNTTGNKRIRAGVPTGWIVGDKTGTGGYGTSNDIAVIWSPQHPPLILAIYFTHEKQSAKYNDQIIALATRQIITTFAHQDHKL